MLWKLTIHVINATCVKLFRLYPTPQQSQDVSEGILFGNREKFSPFTSSAADSGTGPRARVTLTINLHGKINLGCAMSRLEFYVELKLGVGSFGAVAECTDKL